MKQQAILCTTVLLSLATMADAANGGAAAKIQCDPQQARVPYLSWDTEDGKRCDTNLLRANAAVELRLLSGDKKTDCSGLPTKTEAVDGGTQYTVTVENGTVRWSVRTVGADIEMTLACEGVAADALQVAFPFDQRVTPTVAIPAQWEKDGAFGLPAVVNAPDFGPMLLTVERAKSHGSRAQQAPHGRLEGSRTEKWVSFTLDLPLSKGKNGDSFKLRLASMRMEPPAGLKDASLWPLARRGWLNIYQPCSRWGEQNRPFSAPAGVLGNNVISDPCSICLCFYGDHELLLTQIAPGISIAPTNERSIDWWLDNRVRATGEVVGYWDYGGFIDANASPLIAAWDHVEATGNTDWLKQRIDRLEFIAEFLAKRDIDNDGMIEATQSGDFGTLQQPGRSCAWWDAINCGHKDSYTNALCYRGLRCLADLERQLGRGEKAARYTAWADRLKSNYVKELFNPKTGWLAWWKSKDGTLHDYASVLPTGIAVEYGLIEPAAARPMLQKLWAKIDAVGFTHFELGIPSTLVPVLRVDYLLPDAIGCPKREDGTDTFGQYMNGGITAGHVLPFLVANYMCGDRDRADTVLKRMLERQFRGEFQNGVTDEAGKGIDWTTWDGKACGYEGYLSDTYRWQQAVLLREPAFRERMYRPVMVKE